jgi:hypothetical protein
MLRPNRDAVGQAHVVTDANRITHDGNCRPDR